MAQGGGAKQVKLERESELRIEVGNDAPLKLRLLNGTAEIFGTELPPEIWLTFPPRLKFAVTFFLLLHLSFCFHFKFTLRKFMSLIAFCYGFLLLKVFTWYGATIEMDGSTETDYTADEVIS